MSPAPLPRHGCREPRPRPGIAEDAMRIALGIDGADTPERIREWAAAGADEFFAGYIPSEWSERYGWENGLNHRNFGARSQYTSLRDLGAAVAAIHDCGKRITIAFNSHQYDIERLPLVRKVLETVDALDVDAYVIADPALLVCVRDWGIARPLHLSTGAASYNSETVRYFHRLAGIDRVVLPRKMSLREMAGLLDSVRDLDLTFEALIIGYRCFFNDEFCFSWHSSGERNLCTHFTSAETQTCRRFPLDWKTRVQAVAEAPDEQLCEGSDLDLFCRARAMVSDTPGRSGADRLAAAGSAPGMTAAVAATMVQNCGLCAIPALRRLGVSVLKIPARGDQFQKRHHLRVVREIAAHPAPTPEFCRQLINSPEFCAIPGSCYYDSAESEV